MIIYFKCLLLFFLLISLSACNIVRITQPVELITTREEIVEAQLLNIDISVFSPFQENANLDRYLSLNNMRQAESYYTSLLLTETLQASSNWGRVNLNPNQSLNSDIQVHGEILQSDGQTMRVKIRVQDASGNLWFSQEYIQVVSSDSYQSTTITSQNVEPFQALYSKISNDILAYKADHFSDDEILTIRKISELQFANRLAPEIFSPYLNDNVNGRMHLIRFPAVDDPNFIHIRSIQEKNNIYLDTLQNQYSAYKVQISAPYNDFRRRSYTVTKRINDEILSPSPLSVDSPYSRSSTLDVPKAKPPTALERTLGRNANSSFLNRGSRSEMYSRLLILSNQNLELELEPQTLEFNRHIFVLTGTVEEQYEQWSDILFELYELERYGSE